MRDLRQVADKLKVVLLPLGQASQDSVLLKLRECKHLSPQRYSNSSNEADFMFLIEELDIILHHFFAIFLKRSLISTILVLTFSFLFLSSIVYIFVSYLFIF